MGSIIVKFQLCGKLSCHCVNGELHGPYYWFVKYMKPRNSLKKGKYKWQYIGKNAKELGDFLSSSSSSLINSSISEIIEKTENRKKDLIKSEGKEINNITITFD